MDRHVATYETQLSSTPYASEHEHVAISLKRSHSSVTLSSTSTVRDTAEDDCGDEELEHAGSARTVDAYLRNGRKRACCERMTSTISTFLTNVERHDHHPSGDSPLALRVMLAIARHELSLLPESVSPQDLFDLATACNKHGLSDIVAPHIEFRKWINASWVDDKPRDGKWELWLCVAYQFEPRTTSGLLMDRILDVLAANMFLKEGRWIFERGSTQHDVSKIETPECAMGRLDVKLRRRRKQLWRDARYDCSRRQTALSSAATGPNDYYDIGLLCVLCTKLNRALLPEESVTARLRILKKDRMMDGARAAKWLEEKLRLYET